MLALPRPVLLAGIAGIFLLIILLGAFSSSSASLETLQAPFRSGRQFHLLLPATASTLNFCRLLFSSIANGYPEPVLLGWEGHGMYDGAKSHLFKISETLAYLNSLPSSADNDLALVLDAYDIWLLLPPEVMIGRYFTAIDQANVRLKQEGIYGKQYAGSDVRQSIFFGPDKTCWPDDARRPACWSVPESPMDAKAFGPETDAWMVPARPKWLNSGTIMGPVKDMRDMFNATMNMVRRKFDENYEFRTSDQYYFAEVWGEQEVSRILLRDGSVDGERGDLPDLQPDRRAEFHIALDHDSALFQTSAAYAEFLTFMSFNFSSPSSGLRSQTSPGTASIRRLDQISLPADVLASRPPFPTNALPEDSLPTTLSWPDLMLGVNAVNSRVFPLFHMTGDKGYRDRWWHRTWFFPYARGLLKAALRADEDKKAAASKDHALLAKIDGTKWLAAGFYGNATGSKGLSSTRRTGAWSDQGKYLPWGDLCQAYEEELFAG